MPLSPRFVLSLAAGGMLLTLTTFNPVVHAETVPAAPEKGIGKEPQPKSEPGAPLSNTLGSKDEAPVPTPSFVPPQPTAEEARYVDLVNRERARRGLGQLKIEPMLIAVARQHSAEMQNKAYFDHTSPTASLKTPMDRYLKAMSSRPVYACVGENLFWSNASNVSSVSDVQRGHTAFMDSPTHRENVLFPRFEKIGVGIVRNNRGEFWVTEMFLTNTDPVSQNERVAARR
jgi:uncharacterized protein YkwD